jgi:hypothetical protein
MIPAPLVTKVGVVAVLAGALMASPEPTRSETGSEPASAAALPQDLQRARDAVWRAWFANDRHTLERLLPADFVGIGWGGGPWDTRDTALSGAAAFAASGGRLTSLEFTNDRWQRFGNVATVFSNYRLVLHTGEATTTQSGRATEVFVRRNGQWVNPAWHLDSGQ